MKAKVVVIALMIILTASIAYSLRPETLMMDERGNSIVWFPDETSCKEGICMIFIGRCIEGVREVAAVAIFCESNHCGLVSVFGKSSTGQVVEQQFHKNGKVQMDPINPGTPMDFIKQKVCK